MDHVEGAPTQNGLPNAFPLNVVGGLKARHKRIDLFRTELSNEINVGSGAW